MELWHAVLVYGNSGMPANVDAVAAAVGSACVSPAVFLDNIEILKCELTIDHEM
jgi:hypothetical protein